MKESIKVLVLGTSFLVLMSAGTVPEAPLSVGLTQEAAALVGVPFSPVSVAGVARRTTRRAVVLSSSNAAYQQQQIAEQQAAAAQQQAAPAQPAAGAPAIGSVVATLPAGCVPVTSGGVQYQKCGDVYYRAAFQGNNLVYVVTQL